MRLPNGYGTVYRLPGNRRRPWVARVTTSWKIIKDEKTGKEKKRQEYEIVGYYVDKPAALKGLASYHDAPIIPKADMTLAKVYEEWSEKKFKEGKKKKGISRDTVNNYRAAWKYLRVHEKQLFRELRSSHWQDIIDECHEKDMSVSHMKKLKTLVGLLYGYAMQNDIVNTNQAKFIEIPKEEPTKKERFTDLEVKKIKESAKKTPWVDTVLILIRTGLRISEMLNLTKFSVDLKQGIITGGLKTDAGKDRIVPIHKDILEYIKKWYDKGGERLICDDDGKALTAKKYRENYYYPALESAKVRKLTPHKCRHTFCSIAAEKGVDTLYIQLMAGHADYAFTANEYTSPEIEALKKAMDMI